jgi:hypothetical protein
VGCIRAALSGGPDVAKQFLQSREHDPPGWLGATGSTPAQAKPTNMRPAQLASWRGI